MHVESTTISGISTSFERLKGVAQGDETSREMQ